MPAKIAKLRILSWQEARVTVVVKGFENKTDRMCIGRYW